MNKVFSKEKGFKLYLFSNVTAFTSSCTIFTEIGAFTASFLLTVFSSMRFPLQTMSAHFLLADCLSSCAIASTNGAFTFPATHNSFPLLIVFTQESILQKQPFDSASREITKSWFQNLPIHNAEIKLFHVLSWASFHVFLPSFHDMAFPSDFFT